MDISGLQERAMDTIHQILRFARDNPKIALAAAGSGLAIIYLAQQPRNLPPGPTYLPGIGITGFTFSDRLYKDYQHLAEKYGDVFSYYEGETHTALKEAFVTRGDDFADRPQMKFFPPEVFADEIFTAPYNRNEWRSNKKFAAQAFRAFGANRGTADGKILSEIETLRDDLQSKEGTAIDISETFRFATANITSSIMFNSNYSPRDERLEKLVTLNTVLVECIGVYSTKISRLPRWAHEIYYRKYLKPYIAAAKNLRSYINEELLQHHRSFDANNLRDLTDVYLNKRNIEEMRKNFADLIMILLPDSIDTMAVFMSWIILYVTLHPEVQKKIQDEVDSIVGRNKMVMLSDRPQMPYTEATIVEVMRISEASNLTVQHSALQNTTFRGYNIPRSAHIYGNLYSVHMDPQLHHNPDKFKPERFLGDGGKVINKDLVIPFSLGNHMCMGEQLTRMELFLFIANIFQVFTTSFPPGEPLPTTQPGIGLIQPPQPYKVVFNTR